MKLRDSINYALKKVARNKKNIYFIIILMICTTTVIGAIYYRVSTLKSLEYKLNDTIKARSITALPTTESYNYNDLKNIKHIEDFYNIEYSITGGYSESFKNNKYSGNVGLKYGSEFALPKNIEGEVLSANDTGVAICPKYFYPSNNQKINYFDKDMFLTKKDILNKVFNIEREIIAIENDKTVVLGTYIKEFKIIGVYDPFENDDSAMTCYISARDIEELHNKTFEFIENIGISAMEIIVDDINNVKNVTQELVKLGYDVTPKIKADNNYIINIKYISNLIIIIACFGMIILSLLYTDKKNLNEHKKIGILKSLGYKKKDIQLISFLEILCITLISFITGVVFIQITVLLINTIFKNYLIYNNIIIYHSLISYLISFLIIVIIPMLTNYFYTYKNSKKKTITILKEEN